MEKGFKMYGFFTVDKQTQETRIAWTLVVPISIILFFYGVYRVKTIDPNIHWLKSEVVWFLFLFFFLPIIAFVCGLFKMSQKPGLYLRGLRITELGFEAGNLSIELDSITPKASWKKTWEGQVLGGTWQCEQKIADPILQLLICIRQTDPKRKWYHLEKIVLASKESCLYQIEGHSVLNNNLIGMLNNECKLLGDTNPEGPIHTFLPAIERIAEILSNSFSTNPPQCSLIFTPKKSNSPMLVMAIGVLGGLIIAKGSDSLKQKKLHKEFMEKRLFDEDFTTKLFEFANKHNWTITTA